MSTHGLPNDVLSNLDPLALIIFIPICDRFVYPTLARMNIRFTPLKRITLGFFTGASAMVWAAVLQHYIYKTNPCHYSAATCVDADGNALVSPLNVWILRLVVMGAALAMMLGLWILVTRTKLGRAMRATAYDREAAAMMGDDLVDLGAMAAAGLAAAPADAHPWVLARAHWRSRAGGGRGAAREFCDLLLTAQGKADAVLSGFLA